MEICGALTNAGHSTSILDEDSQSSRRNAVAEFYCALRRRRLLTSLCATLLILWLLLAAIAGAILLFKYLHRKPIYYGWCGADYVEHDMKPAKLQERVEIDQENEYEKIEVPQFGPYRPGTFIHDFRQNLTAIIDVWGEQCFIKSLDRRQTAPPSGFIDLVRKVESGYYDQNAAVIRERFNVRLPALTYDEVRNLGSWVITHQCGHMKSYMLEKARHLLERPRRSVGGLAKCPNLQFAFYNAHGSVIQDSIELGNCA